MKQTRFFLLVGILSATISLNSCGPTVKVSASWVNKEKIQPQRYKSVFLLVLTQNLEAKAILENDLTTAAKARGFTVYRSIDIFGPVSGKENFPLKDMMMKKVKDLGCETIFTVALVDAKSETKYVPGSSAIYSPYSYGAYGGYGMYGGFGGYYGYSTSLMYSPGYYSTDKTYFIESNLYDANTEDLLMTIQSKAANPPAIQKSSKLYMASLIEEIKRLRP